MTLDEAPANRCQGCSWKGRKLLPKPNLLLITVDALRADHLGCLGYAAGLSPHIDRLASDGVLFSQAIAHGP
ncbi:MAG: sulfatase-like hydrolase/transferase, partial [Anaerolineae bacterium]